MRMLEEKFDAAGRHWVDRVKIEGSWLGKAVLYGDLTQEEVYFLGYCGEAVRLVFHEEESEFDDMQSEEIQTLTDLALELVAQLKPGFGDVREQYYVLHHQLKKHYPV